MKPSKSTTLLSTIILHAVTNASLCSIFTAFFLLSLDQGFTPQYQQIFCFPVFFREEVKVLGEMRELTYPCRIAPAPVPIEKPAPSTMASSSGIPLEPLVVKPDTSTVHVTRSFAEWLTLGLPSDLCMLPLPTKLPGNCSQHTCPLCMDIKMSADRAYNHIHIEHLGVLLQCCFCNWSSGSARMMQEHILKHHKKDDGSCMIAGLEPTPRATCH